MAEQLRKALSTGDPGGHGLLQTLVAKEVLPLIRQRSYMRQFLREIEMPSPTFEIPKMLTADGVYGVSEGGTPSEASVDVGEITLTAKKLMLKLPINAEIAEDAVVSLIPLVKDEIVRAFAVAEEKVWLNGDVTSGSSNINGTLSAGDPKLLINGIRAHALDGTTGKQVDAGNDAFSIDLVSEMLYKLDIYADVKDDLLLIVPRAVEAQIRKLKDFLSIQAYAAPDKSTLLSGEIGKIFGVKVVATSLLPENLNSAGKYDGSTTDRTSAIMLHRNSYVLGDRRKFQIRSSDEVLMANDQILVVASERVAGAAAYVDAMVVATNVKKSLA